MQLGTFLDGARHAPPVVHPIRFRACAQNAAAQPSRVEVEAVLTYVSEEERIPSAVEAAEYLAEKFPGRPIGDKERRVEESIRFLALALRDKADPTRPLCAGGADELRAVLLYSVADWLVGEYQDFVAREFHPNPPDEEKAKMREAAAGK